MKTYKNLAFVFLFVLLFSCTQLVGTIDHLGPQVQIIEGQLIISFDNTVPTEFAIQTPSKKWFYVVQPSDNIDHIGDSYKTGNVKLNLASFTASHWVSGKHQVGLVFNQAGDYLLYFADNIETEPENTVGYKKRVVISSH